VSQKLCSVVRPQNAVPITDHDFCTYSYTKFQ